MRYLRSASSSLALFERFAQRGSNSTLPLRAAGFASAFSHSEISGSACGARVILVPRLALIALSVVCVGSFVASASLAAEKAAESTMLFDGKSFRGWEGDTKSVWRLVEGALVAGSHDRRAPQNEFLTTKQQFSDFDLTLKFRIDVEGDEADKDVNAGVQFRTERIPDHHEVIGYQADIGEDVWGHLYDESRRRRMLATPEPETVAKALAAVGKDGWHTYRIRAEGPRIQLWLNGVQTVDYTETDPKIPRTGVVAVQIHGKMQGVVRYREIRIVELPADEVRRK